VDDLESEIGDLESQVLGQQEEAKEAISLWEQRCASLETEMTNSQDVEDLKVQLSSLKEDMAAKQNMLDDMVADLTIENKNVQTLTQVHNDAEKIYKGYIEELEIAIQDHLTANEELQDDLQTKDESLAIAEGQVEAMATEIVEIRSQSEEVVTQWQENSKELEDTIAKLEKTIEKQNIQATTAIEQWEARCNALIEQIKNAEHALSGDGVHQLLEDLKTELVDKDHALKNYLEERDYLAKETHRLVEVEKNLTVTINELHAEKDKMDSALLAEKNVSSELQLERDNALTSMSKLDSEIVTKHELETSFSELQTLLNTTKAEMDGIRGERETLQQTCNLVMSKLDSEIAVKQELEASFSELQTLLSGTKAEMDRICGERETLQQTCNLVMSKLDSEIAVKQELEASFSELQTLLSSTKFEMNGISADRENLQKRCETEKQELEEKMSSAEDEKRRLQEAMYISEDEVNELKIIIGQLEVELNEANDALQSHFTDEVTVRATERAAMALRAQIKEMRDKNMFDHQAFANEKEARLNAEAEVEELKRGLALLAQSTEFMDGEEGQLHLLTSKAAAEIMHREREEIESLQKSLEHVIAELKTSKLKERDAEDQAANSRMHASVCEQELLSTKSDVDQLRQALDESKKCEVEMQMLLEKRVKVLEEDRQNIMNVNRADFEASKAELSNTIIERDQLIHALNESEKANSTLVYSTTVEIEKENAPSLDLELSRLRMENAQLLCSAAKTAAKTERRIRSALGGDLTAVEENIKSEKQRYKEAEQTLETMKCQHEAVVKELERMKANNKDLIAKMKSFEASNVTEDLKRLEVDFSRLELEKISLETKLNESMSSSKANISKLDDKCKTAEAKIRRLESAERKEAALAAEIAKIREENEGLKQGKINSTASFDDGAVSNAEAKGQDIDATDQLDLIRDLQSEMNQEREIYQELLCEHEDLLALLAQQDCEKKCLQQALAKVDGNDAVEKAILKAEEKVVQQFGKYVQIK